MKHAIVVGSEGQDGRLISDLLRKSGCEVLGIGRRGAVDILDPAAVSDAVGKFQPQEIYYLAAVHHASQDHSDSKPGALLRDSFRVNVDGLLNFLDAARSHTPKARLFYAASSHVFGLPVRSPQDEITPLNPACAYGITKVAGIQCCRFYREKHGVFAACGILYNHESIYRRPEFVTRKIVSSAARIQHGKEDKLILGDLSAKVDWGYAPDYVDAVRRILQLPEPQDFVVATGIEHSVQEFVEIAFSSLGLDWRKYVTEQRSIALQRREGLVGDSSKLRRLTGWTPTLDFERMVRLLAAQAEEADRS
jgi:GDPmannose 4,6-dehydratase